MIALVNRWITAFNRAPAWKRQVHIGNYTIQAPNFDRWLYVKLHSLRLMGSEERNFLSRHVRPGMTVLDIGANIGLYSVFLAELVGNEGKVFAFEPDPGLFEYALANARQNGKQNIIKPHNLALGSQSGTAILYRTIHNSGDNRLSASPTHKEGVPVKIARLDEILCDAKVDFIKMDVQGWEAEVLRGMEETLRRNSELTIYFEYWPKGLRNSGELLSAPIDILRECGFSVFLPEQDKPLSTRQIEDLGNACSRNKFVNLLAKRG